MGTGTGAGVLHFHEEEEDGDDMDKVAGETEDVESHLGSGDTSIARTPAPGRWS